MKKKIAIIVSSLLVLTALAAVLKRQDYFGGSSSVTYTFTTTEGKAKIPFSMVGSHVTFAVSINESEPLNIVLDTGMPMPNEIMFWNSEKIENLQLNYTDKTEIQGAGGEREKIFTQIAKSIPVTLDEIEFHDLNVMVMPGTGSFTNHFDGVIGAAFFRNFVVEVNHDDMMIYLSEKSTYLPNPQSGAVPFHIADRFPQCTVDLTVGDKIIATDLVIDLGASHVLSLNTENLDNFHLPEKTISTALGKGLSGMIYGDIGRVEKIQLGGFALENIVASFPRPDQQKNVSNVEKNGNLGNGFFSRFNVTFDYANKLLYLEPNHSHSDAFEYDMSGLRKKQRDDGLFLVTELIKNSPAELAGVKPDDVIVAINGRPASELTKHVFARMCEKDGETLVLTISRNNEPVEVSLKLRRLI